MPVTLSSRLLLQPDRPRAVALPVPIFPPRRRAAASTVAQERPDFLLSDFNIYTFNIQLRDVSGAEGAAAYDADLRIHAGYAQVGGGAESTGSAPPGGVRYEDADPERAAHRQHVRADLARQQLLAARGDIDLDLHGRLQLRLHASKTIARPQFRELAPQIYQDFESDREFTGNPFLTDSELLNAEARLEYYFARDQRITLAGFYKRIDNPIEAAAFFAGGGQLRDRLRQRPASRALRRARSRSRPIFRSNGLGGRFFATRRLLFIGNYTYSQLGDQRRRFRSIVGPDLQPVAANLLFRDGAPMTGQSDHLANLQIGIEDTDSLSPGHVRCSRYASERVTNRGPIQGLARQPDFIERPGFRLDFVAAPGSALLRRAGRIQARGAQPARPGL